jgi:5-methylcytosine-specific restriction endonuclease McrA
MKDKCVNCGKQAEHYHHIIPRSLGGTDNETNLVALCNTCHGKLHGLEYTDGKLSHSELIKKG